MTGRVILAPYDPEWPRRFDQEAVVLGAVFAGSDAAIEHVGSTAVPGLWAKPVAAPNRPQQYQEGPDATRVSLASPPGFSVNRPGATRFAPGR